MSLSRRISPRAADAILAAEISELGFADLRVSELDCRVHAGFFIMPECCADVDAYVTSQIVKTVNGD
jgi:hypothetical protein